MQLIADMIDEIMEEYEGAEAYAKKAVQCVKPWACSILASALMIKL